jgi:Domain of unknown function (DUF4209)
MDYRDDFAEQLRRCLGDSDEWHQVERCFRESIDQEDQGEVDAARPVVHAFGYMLVASRRDELRERVGVYGAQWEMDGRIFPPRLDEADDETLGLWEAYAKATNDFPLASSRLCDLLWVRQYGNNPVEHAKSAFDGYLALAQDAEGMHLVDSLLRAIEIAAEINDEERLAVAVSKALAVSQAEIADTSERRPGIPLNLIEAIVDLDPAKRPEALKDLLSTASERYGDDPFIAQSVSELKVALADRDEQENLRQQQVALWREEAKKGDAILRQSRLQQALGLARTYGLGDVAREVLVEMQAIKPEDFDLKPITAEIEIPRAEIDAHLKSYGEDSDSWEDALRRFGSEGPPSGDAIENADLTKELAEKYPIQRLFRTQVMGPHGSTTAAASSDEEHDRVDLAKWETMRIRVWAPIGVEILEMIKQAFGAPDRDVLTNYFTTELIDPEVAARIADGLLRFFDSDDDGALHILVPQLEAAIRGAAAQAGVVVIKTPRGGTPGGVRALGGIVADLKGRLDESWRRYLANALSDPLGLNLRNQLSHGLHGPTGRADVAIAIHIACHLALWRPGGEEPSASPDDK